MSLCRGPSAECLCNQPQRVQYDQPSTYGAAHAIFGSDLMTSTFGETISGHTEIRAGRMANTVLCSLFLITAHSVPGWWWFRTPLQLHISQNCPNTCHFRQPFGWSGPDLTTTVSFLHYVWSDNLFNE